MDRLVKSGVCHFMSNPSFSRWETLCGASQEEQKHRSRCGGLQCIDARVPARPWRYHFWADIGVKLRTPWARARDGEISEIRGRDRGPGEQMQGAVPSKRNPNRWPPTEGLQVPSAEPAGCPKPRISSPHHVQNVG